MKTSNILDIINEFFFLLGSPDPERYRMVEILEEVGASWSYATHNGELVNPRSAYYADMPDLGQKKLVLVECDTKEKCEVYKRIDHHRPGDYGYKLGPERFFEASAIGQLCKFVDYMPTESDYYVAAIDHCLSHALRRLCPGIDPAVVRAWDTYASDDQLKTYEDKISHSPVLYIGDQTVFFLKEDIKELENSYRMF